MEKSTYNPYIGLKLRYDGMLLREGAKVSGSVEKVWEKSIEGEKEYIGEHRTIGVVDGFIEKKLFSKDKICLHVVEDGEKRKYSTFYTLSLDHKGKLIGTFTSTAGKAEGKAIWQREPFL